MFLSICDPDPPQSGPHFRTHVPLKCHRGHVTHLLGVGGKDGYRRWILEETGVVSTGRCCGSEAVGLV